MVAVAILEFHAIECAQGFISSILLVLFQQEVAVVDLAGYLPRGYLARHHDVVNAFPFTLVFIGAMHIIPEHSLGIA